MVKYFHEKEKAVQITVRLDGDVQRYALSLLQIINNARVFPNMLYKVENNSENDVYVTCRMKYAESVKEYLEQFGKIILMEEINWIIIKAQYDKSGWEELFGDDCEVEFTVEID